MNSTPAIRYAAWISEFSVWSSIRRPSGTCEIIRPATPKPPKMLIEATVAATKASTTTRMLVLPSCSSAPTRMMPEIAFVCAISGVCSDALTLVIT